VAPLLAICAAAEELEATVSRASCTQEAEEKSPASTMPNQERTRVKLEVVRQNVLDVLESRTRWLAARPGRMAASSRPDSLDSFFAADEDAGDFDSVAISIRVIVVEMVLL